MRVKNKSSIYNRGQWDAYDRVLNSLNSIDVPKDMTADQMRRRIYGMVMNFTPAGTIYA